MKNIHILSIIIAVAVVSIVGYLVFGTTNDGDMVGEETDNQVMNLGIETLTEGEGEGAQDGQLVAVHYTGTLEDGTVFDSSIERGNPIVFPLGSGHVIPGWELGILGMKVGEVRKLTIPPELGYGEAGAGDVIPSNATLIFEVELVGIQ